MTQPRHNDGRRDGSVRIAARNRASHGWHEYHRRYCMIVILSIVLQCSNSVWTLRSRACGAAGGGEDQCATECVVA